MVEAIEENYQGTLNDMKVLENHPSRFILVQKVKEEPFERIIKRDSILSTE